ncbi:MAG: RusA family crossover junction endodeoxyribonuclease [Deltaproteobacteria bacterium]|nr:RusA family crossover junction endodeoxyribonuclease [Deltaproteobacteria bacterium]
MRELADVTLRLPIAPAAKGRPKARVLQLGARTIAQMYTPATTRAFEATIADMAAARLEGRILEGPLRVDILAVLQRPQGLLRKRDPEGITWAPKRPDRDNLEKAVLDGLSACFRDDAQVVAGETIKVYAEKTGCPRVVVRIRQLGEQDLLAAANPEALAASLGLLVEG